ncbi:hypothetical protein CTI14_01675 [Methylobacterium radiotolerans]|nr:hypothetical protein CTI14_01675 [Methylobacterium radiotolerans]
MPAAAQQLDGWPAVVIALLGALGVLLVPLTGFMKEWWGYKKEVRAAKALKPEVARDVAVTPGATLFDSIALADLTKAVNGLTAAIVAETASEEAQHTNQMTAAIARLTETLDRWDDDHPRQPRGRR